MPVESWTLGKEGLFSAYSEEKQTTTAVMLTNPTETVRVNPNSLLSQTCAYPLSPFVWASFSFTSYNFLSSFWTSHTVLRWSAVGKIWWVDRGLYCIQWRIQKFICGWPYHVTIPPYNKQLVFGVASTNGSFSEAPQQTGKVKMTTF